MDKKIHFEIVTPERTVYKDEVDEIILPTKMGEIAILPNHVPLVAVLKAGELRVKKGKEEIPMAVSGGFIEVQKNKVVVLADSAEHVHEIDEQKAEEARAKAQELLKTKQDEEDFAAVSALLEKELARLKVARKYPKHSHRGGTLPE